MLFIVCNTETNLYDFFLCTKRINLFSVWICSLLSVKHIYLVAFKVVVLKSFFSFSVEMQKSRYWNCLLAFNLTWINQ